jgi:glycerophosphoryl diester phosphodiesterase
VVGRRHGAAAAQLVRRRRSRCRAGDRAGAAARAHVAGLRLLAYTVNDEADARRLWALGADGLITDAVDRFDPTT